MKNRIYRYEIELGDKPQEFRNIDTPIRAAISLKGPHIVEFWAYTNVDSSSDNSFNSFWLQIFGTGHDLPEFAIPIATTERDPLTGLVWHLVRVHTQKWEHSREQAETRRFWMRKRLSYNIMRKEQGKVIRITNALFDIFGGLLKCLIFFWIIYIVISIAIFSSTSFINLIAFGIVYYIIKSGIFD